MQTVFGVPADQLLTVLLVLVGLIFAGVGLTALRYPLPFRLGMRNLPRRKTQTMLIVVGLALSTMIITSALGIGDTVDYSVKAAVYDNLGAIDMELSGVEQNARTGIGFSSSVSVEPTTAVWFDAAVAARTAALVDGQTFDGAVAIAEQKLPVSHADSGLSEAAVTIRGIGAIAGDGLTAPEGFDGLQSGEALINAALAQAIDARAGDTLLLFKGRPTPVTIAGVVPDGALAGSAPTLIWPLAEMQQFFGEGERVTSVLLSNVGTAVTGVTLTDRATALLEPLAGDQLVINPLKADQLQAAADSAEFMTTLFITFGAFSIFSGLLLIVLIFSVLAAERKSELGMGRAVGLQRADLIRQFVSEGLAYNFLAATLGALLGIAAAFLLARGIAALAANSPLTIVPTVSPRSAVIAFSLGLVITFVTVSLSAVRISRINIIAAIRDLNLPSLPRESQWSLFLHPFIVWRAAVQKAGAGNLREAARLFVLAGPKAILNFWGGLAARGPVLMALGFLIAWLGVNVAGQVGVYSLGVSLFWIGLGQLAVWFRAPQRLAYSLVGLTLILYWSLPVRSTGRLAELSSNPGDFFISGLFLVGGAIMLFLYNADSLLNLFAGLLGRFGRLLPVARVSIAYPVANKSRTATTLAMFSLIIFTLVGTTTITNTFSNFLDPISGSGDYDVLVQTNPFNPVEESVLRTAVADLAASGKLETPTALAPVAFGPVRAQSPEMSAPSTYLVNGVGDDFFATQRLELGSIAVGYADAAAVWSAVQSDPTLIVIDDFSVDRGGDPTSQLDSDRFSISSIRAVDAQFEPVPVQIIGADGRARDFTVIGVISSAPNFYGATMNTAAAAELGVAQPNRFFLRLTDGSDARAAANAIESALSAVGAQTSLPKEELEAGRATIRSIFFLIQGFIGLGLLIGIAALGVVTIRAVVERRQQIGVLRAIGFTRSMVQNVFLFEGVFVSALATLIGYGLAMTFAYNLYLQVAAQQGLRFMPPWTALIGIGAAIITASLLTAWLPARATSKVVIAEALRYE